MKTSYLLRKDQCAALRSSWGGKTTTGSPFDSMPRSGISDDIRKYFIEIGLLNQNYQPTRHTEELLKILALPALHTIIGYIDSKSSFKVHIYLGSGEREKCVTISQDDAINLFYPCITGEIIEYINNIASIPHFSPPATPRSFSLSRSEVAILAVLIDIQRQSYHSQAQEGIKPEMMRTVTSNPYEIFEIIHNYKNNPLKWPILTFLFDYVPFEAVTDEDVKKALSRFFALGFLSRSGDGYILDPALQALAQRLVSITFVLFVPGVKFKPVPGIHEVNHSLLGGSGIVLKITNTSRARDVITLDIVSFESVHLLLRDLIENPEGQFEETGTGYSSKMTADILKHPSSPSCPSCGASLGDSAKFCRNCGASVVPAVKPDSVLRCPNCGSPLKTGARFCSKCGKGLS